MPRIPVGAMTFLLLASMLHAQDAPRQPEPEKILPPKVIVQPPPATTIYIEPYYVRPGTREVWQHYGVSSLGRYVPRVILTPEGAYYSRDLMPYPWPMNRSTAIMPR